MGGRHSKGPLVTMVRALQPPGAPSDRPLPAQAAGPAPWVKTTRLSPAPRMDKPPRTSLHKTTDWAKDASAIVRARTELAPLHNDVEAVVSSGDEDADQTWGTWGSKPLVDRPACSSNPVGASNGDWVGGTGDWEVWGAGDWDADKWSSHAWNQPPEQHSSARCRSRSPAPAAAHGECPETVFQYLRDDYGVDSRAFRAPGLDTNCC